MDIYNELVADTRWVKFEQAMKDKRQRQQQQQAEQEAQQQDLPEQTTDRGSFVAPQNQASNEDIFVERRSGIDRRQQRNSRGRFIDSRLTNDRRQSQIERIVVQI